VGCRWQSLRAAPIAMVDCAHGKRKGSKTRRRRALIEEKPERGLRCWHKRRRVAVADGSGAAVCGDGTLQRHMTGEQGRLPSGPARSHNVIFYLFKYFQTYSNLK
jgi:hypothetical protein